MPPRPADNVLMVPVDNIGPGAALDAPAQALVLNDDGSCTPGIGGGELEAIAPEVVGAAVGGGVWRTLELRAPGWGQSPRLELRLFYKDVTGKPLTTIAKFYGDPPRWRAIRPQSDDALPQPKRLHGVTFRRSSRGT